MGIEPIEYDPIELEYTPHQAHSTHPPCLYWSASLSDAIYEYSFA